MVSMQEYILKTPPQFSDIEYSWPVLWHSSTPSSEGGRRSHPSSFGEKHNLGRTWTLH